MCHTRLALQANQVARTLGTRIEDVQRLDHEIESAVVERAPRRRLDPHEAFALSFASQRARSKVAIGVVARAPEERVGGEGASTHTRLGEGTSAAEAPKIVERSPA